MKQIQAFILDLDGVITDTAEYHFLAWRELAAELGIELDRTFNEKLKGISRMDSLERILEYGGQQQALTYEQKLELTIKKNNHYIQLIRHITPQDILPGMRTFIEELKSEGYKLGLASASKNAMMVIEQLDLKSYFDTIVDARGIRNGKPDPEIYLTAAKQLGAIPSFSIGIEDAASGIEAIHRAGMFAVGIGSEEALSNADYLVSNSSELSLDGVLKHFQHWVKKS